MDSSKYLILIKKEDKTDSVENFSIQDSLVNVQYINSAKSYNYKKYNFEFYENPQIISIDELRKVAQKQFYNVSLVLKFGDFYKVFFQNGTSLIFNVNSKVNNSLKDSNIFANISDSEKTDNIFEYFKEISKIVSVRTEDGMALLEKEFNKINFINSETVLYKYINTTSLLKKYTINEDVIYPFGSNESQYNAVRNALKNQVSIIEGPPGTGKTQTILNILANIVKNGKCAAVVSNNNAAIDNIYEKLEKYDLEYLCARLGKRENKKKFFESQTGTYPQFQEKLDNETEVKNRIISLNKNVQSIYRLKNKIAKLKEELDTINTEYQYFKIYEGRLKNIKIRKIFKVSSSQVMKVIVEIEDLQSRNQEINFWMKFKICFFFGMKNINIYADEFVLSLKNLYFKLKQHEIEDEIKKCEGKLKIIDSDNKIQKLTKQSLVLLNESLRKKYNHLDKTRRIFKEYDVNKNIISFIKEYPIILSTTYSIKNCLNLNFIYDYLIMDESSQVDLITGVLALSVAKNVVIVGDSNQLPNVITTENRNNVEEVAKKYNISKEYDYLENSFLSSVSKVFKNAPRTLLREHYRCHPKIIEFCNKKFYNNELIIMTKDSGEDDVLKAIVTPAGNHAKGHENQRQIDVIKNEIIPELKGKTSQIGLISPYRAQTNKLRETLDDEYKINTVHKFQGREEEAIVLTTVDNVIGDFVDDYRMLNVAVSRAQRYLRLVISDNKENEGSNIYDLLKYIRYNNFEVVESKVKSIYDLLYKENRNKRLAFLKNKKRISEYDSENLTYNLIENILKENNLNSLDIAVHVPLREVVSDLKTSLTPREYQYAINDWTHLDFVIFNKMDKKTIMAIEVDGFNFHKKGTVQSERDKLKDSILSKYEIPFVRLKTERSDEKEKIVSLLMNNN